MVWRQKILSKKYKKMLEILNNKILSDGHVLCALVVINKHEFRYIMQYGVIFW
jgi:hypothetical protein